VIRVEITGVSATQITIALYYPVADQDYSEAAIDDTREPAGSALDAAGVAKLNAGRIVELVKSVRPQARTIAQLKATGEQLWNDSKAEARREYRTRYSYLTLPETVGSSWDGSVWQSGA